jgi:hypothetical protein
MPGVSKAQVFFVHGRVDAGVALRGQRQQRAAGLRHAAGLHIARQHHRVDRAGDLQPRQPGRGHFHRGLGLRHARGGHGGLDAAGLVGGGLHAGGLQRAARGVQQALGIVKLLLREEAFRHQVTGALEVALGGLEGGLGLHHGLAGHRGRHRGLLGGAAAGLHQRGAGLMQGGARFGVGQAHQQVAGLDAVALAHLHSSTVAVTSLPMSMRAGALSRPVATTDCTMPVRTTGETCTLLPR